MLKPQAGNYSKESVYKLGSHIAKQLEYKPNGDINQAIEKAGGRIEYRNPMDSDGGDSDSIEIEKAGVFKIFLSIYTSANRDRFTVAHELGHYVLHYFLRERTEGHPLGPMHCTRAGEGKVEWEANWFAAGFLMPEEDFKEIYDKESGDLDQIAAYFGVSRSAVEIRKRVLSLN